MIELDDELFNEALDTLAALKEVADDMEVGPKLSFFAQMANCGLRPISVWQLRRLVDALEALGP